MEHVTGSGARNIATVFLAAARSRAAAITNDNRYGIQGFGTVTSQVINNTKLSASMAAAP